MIFPGYLVLMPIGASGTLAQILALLVFMMWMVATLFGLHNSLPMGSPARATMLFWVAASCLSYAAMYAGFSGPTDMEGRASADRWMILVVAGAGITLVTAETLKTVEDILAVTKWLVAAGAVCALVAMIQFIFAVNPVDWIAQLMVGFTDNGSGTVMQTRGNFTRVAGTTMHPIELAVVCTMILPLSIWWAFWDRGSSLMMRISLPLLLLIGNIVTVSRTGMIALAVAALIFVPYLTRTAKLWSLILIPCGVVGIFFLVPGMVATLFNTATAGTADLSITYRTDDYPLAWGLFFRHPIFGLGPGTWIPANAKSIFDNQYLLSVVTLGAVGLCALLAYVLVPAFSMLMAARHAAIPGARLLAGAVAAAMFVAAISMGTFDAMSFQTFALICPFFVGLAGSSWTIIRQDSTAISEPSTVVDGHNLGGKK